MTKLIFLLFVEELNVIKKENKMGEFILMAMLAAKAHKGMMVVPVATTTVFTSKKTCEQGKRNLSNQVRYSRDIEIKYSFCTER